MRSKEQHPCDKQVVSVLKASSLRLHLTSTPEDDLAKRRLIGTSYLTFDPLPVLQCSIVSVLSTANLITESNNYEYK